MSALPLHTPPATSRPALAPVAPIETGETDNAAFRLAEAEVLIARQQKVLREAETLLGVVEDAVAELAAAHSPTVRRLSHAASRTRLSLAPAS